MTAVLAVAIVLAGPTTVHPRYENYPVTTTFRGTAAEPNLASHPEARRYRTRLGQAARSGPNFAGHFMLVSIGCGTGCAEVAVVDAADGSVYFPRGLRMVQWAGWWHEPAGLQYRLSSSLVIVYGVANEEETVGHYGVSYFVWNGRDFDLIAFEARDRGQPPK